MHTSIELNETTYSVEFEYDQGEPATYDHPGSHPGVSWIYSVTSEDNIQMDREWINLNDYEITSQIESQLED